MAKTETYNAPALTRSWLPPLDGGTAIMAALIGFMGFYVLYPLTLIVVNSFNTATIAEPEVYGLDAWRKAFAEPGIWRSLWNSVKIGLVLQVVALPTGIFISWLLARTNILFPNAMEFGFWISFFMPGLATTFGWMLMLDPSTGLINSWLRQMPLLSGLNFDIYSFWGIVFVHLVGNGISTKVMLMTPAFRRMDASMEEASRMSGASAFTTLVRITVPALTPVIIVVFLLSVIRIFSSLEIELLAWCAMGFLCLLHQDRRPGAPGTAIGKPGRGVGECYPVVSCGFYSAAAQTHLAPPVHHRHRPIQTEDHRAWDLALSGDGLRRLGAFRSRRGAAALRARRQLHDPLRFFQSAENLDDGILAHGAHRSAHSSGVAEYFDRRGQRRRGRRAVFLPDRLCLGAHQAAGPRHTGFDLLAAVGDSRCAFGLGSIVDVSRHAGVSAVLRHHRFAGGCSSARRHYPGDANSQSEFRPVGQRT